MRAASLSTLALSSLTWAAPLTSGITVVMMSIDFFKVLRIVENIMLCVYRL
jgi:hypothetical protein